MPAQRLSMRQVREVLRLKHMAGHSERRIAAAVGISRYTVAEYLRRALVVGITWPVPLELDDPALEARPFSPPFDSDRGDVVLTAIEHDLFDKTAQQRLALSICGVRVSPDLWETAGKADNLAVARPCPSPCERCSGVRSAG